jgi:hypothetical protein
LVSSGARKNVRGVYEKVDDGWWRVVSNEQDRAAQESQGLIYDRSKNETLGTSDRGVVMWRHMAFESIKAVQEGRDPAGVVREGDENAEQIIEFDASKNFSDSARELGEERALS